MTGAIIQARLGSSRLPGKVLREIAGKPMLQHVIERAQKIPGIHKVIVAIPHTDIKELASRIKADVFWYMGHPEDVLDRYYQAASTYDMDLIMRLTGDCPLIDPQGCGRLLAYIQAFDGIDYVSNVATETDGLDCEVFTMDALRRAHSLATAPYDREHVTPWIRHNLRCVTLPEPALPGKWSVDTEEDLQRVAEVLS